MLHPTVVLQCSVIDWRKQSRNFTDTSTSLQYRLPNTHTNRQIKYDISA